MKKLFQGMIEHTFYFSLAGACYWWCSHVVHKQVHCDNIDLFAVWMREVKTVFGDLLINKGEMVRKAKSIFCMHTMPLQQQHNCQCKCLDAAVSDSDTSSCVSSGILWARSSVAHM